MTCFAAVPLLVALTGGSWCPQPPAPAPPAATHLEACDASWYGPGFDGRPTASGVLFDPDAMTAAHRTLELGTVVQVTHDGRTVQVTVNDRGPFTDPGRRCLDLSRAAFAELAPLDAGVIPVTIDTHHHTR